jgi:hypothetical protein
VVEPHRYKKDTISLSVLDNIFLKWITNILSNNSYDHDRNWWYSNLGNMVIHIYLYLFKLCGNIDLYLWIFHAKSTGL